MGAPSLINSRSGRLVVNNEKPFILALTPGENLFEAILQCVNDAQIKSASISGLGGLDDITIAYYNVKTKEYQTKLFKGMYELISLNGNIVLCEGKLFLHIHAALGQEDYQVIGGHIMSAIVSPAAEITVLPLSSPIGREYDSITGIKPLCPINK